MRLIATLIALTLMNGAVVAQQSFPAFNLGFGMMDPRPVGEGMPQMQSGLPLPSQARKAAPQPPSWYTAPIERWPGFKSKWLPAVIGEVEPPPDMLRWFNEMELAKRAPDDAELAEGSRSELAFGEMTPSAVQRFLEGGVTDRTAGFSYVYPPEPLAPEELRAEIKRLELGDQSEVMYHLRDGRSWVVLTGEGASSVLCDFGAQGAVSSCFLLTGRYAAPSCHPVVDISSRLLLECDAVFGTGTGWFSSGLGIFEVQEKLTFYGFVDTYEHVSSWGDITNGGTLYFRNALSWGGEPHIETVRLCPTVEYEIETQRVERRLPCAAYDFSAERDQFLNLREGLSDRYKEVAGDLKAEASAGR
jgi:hypothetical protein